MQKGYFPTKNIYLSQGYGVKSGSHKHSYALDLAGTYRPFAPFDCTVTKVYAPTDKKKSREVWLTSDDKIICANGKCDYLTISITHPSNIIYMSVGQHFKQFQDLNIPTNDMTGYYSGNHAHIELSLGKQAGWDSEIIKKYKEYVNVNKIKPEEFLYVTSDTTIEKCYYQGDKYNFIKDNGKEYILGVYKCEFDMYLRSEPNRNSIPLKIKDLNSSQRKACTKTGLNDVALYKKGTRFTALDIIINNEGEYWAKTYNNAYICIDDNKTQYCIFDNL